MVPVFLSMEIFEFSVVICTHLIKTPAGERGIMPSDALSFHTLETLGDLSLC